MFENRRTIVKLFLDAGAIVVAVFFAFILRYEDVEISTELLREVVYYTGIYYAISIAFKNIQISWSYTDSYDVFKLITIHIITLILTIFFYSILREDYSRQVLALTFLFSLVIQLLMRMFFRMNRQYKYGFLKPKHENGKRTLIYGAGEAGVMLARESKLNKNFSYNILGFIDDDKKKQGIYINGIKVYGNKKTIKHYVQKLKIEVLIIAIPSLELEDLKHVMKEMENLTNVEVKMLPLIEKSLADEPLLNKIRNVKIEDLLGREQVVINDGSIKGLIEGKTIFVTGGAGSIGSELARQIAKFKPKKLVTLDVNENDIYFLELELKRRYPDLDLVSEICNIREKEKLEFLFEKYRPNVVFHAAAHKHVPLMEHNPEEAIKNNIFGTKKVAECADKYGVERMVLISTDKAVNPTNLMGASKRACELVIEHMNKVSKNTKFMAVRFGNVLGSNGSVIPIFKKLIEEGKNLTLTHKDITRYFMTIPEAAQLVIEAGAIGKGGEIFILDMGEPVKIYDLAKSMIRLSNASVGIDIIGLRPGEKLYEELLYDVNSAIKTENKKIFITKIEDGAVDITKYFDRLEECTHRPNIEEIKEVMKGLVVSYKEVKYN
jgi:FlaA1/EpsC-like NDP-sugar epimerase